MDEDAIRAFLESFYEDVIEAMEDADKEPVDAQYRLGVRRLAKAFFDKLELYQVGPLIPGLLAPDVDAWFAGRGNG